MSKRKIGVCSTCGSGGLVHKTEDFSMPPKPIEQCNLCYTTNLGSGNAWDTVTRRELAQAINWLYNELRSKR
jgi:hypothetical protein